MSLTNRLLLFFLATLALVLAGFSTSLYLVARSYLSRQVDERLDSALTILTAFVEQEDPGLEWEIRDRHLTLGVDSGADQVRWVVRDDRGRHVATSPNLADNSQFADALLAFHPNDAAHLEMNQAGTPWRVAQRQMDDAKGAGRALPDERYHTLLLTVGSSLAPMHALLRNLALALSSLSLAVWILAAAGGYLVCRRALWPVSRMATAARAINAAALDQRLPTLQTGDELADLGRAFNDLLSRLQESFERQRRFTGDASHQLRTPLAAMLGQVEVALRRPRSQEEYQRVLDLVRDQSVHLRQIVEALLFLARADAESKQPQLDRIDLAAWLREHVCSWSSHPRVADLIVDCPPDTALWIDAQPPLLGQLVDNVWDNACKYSDQGTPITLRLRQAGDLICLSVEDHGCGVADDELPLVFEPFFRSQHSRQTGVGGIGLGLAIVRRIASALGGTTSLHSKAGGGSTFRLCLPGQSERLPSPVAGKS
jgi:heavy metal sensor kinase